jgi:subtilisin family serine protease
VKSKFALFITSLLLVGCFKKASTNNSAKEVVSETSPTSNTNTDGTRYSDPIIIDVSDGVDSGDPLEQYAWHLNNTGQSTFSDNGGVSGIDLNRGTITASGTGVLIAVSDNGIEKGHEDLSSNFSLAFSKNYSLSTANWLGDPTPGTSAHGTAVSGIIAAKKGNGLGSRGVAANAIIAGFKYVGVSVNTSMQVDQANGNYDIFNYSYGGYSCIFDHSSSTYISQLEYGVKNLRFGKGAIYVKAAGNEYYSHASDCNDSIGQDENIYYFGNANLEEVHSYPWMIVTGAVNASGISASYSTPGSSVWISGLGGEFGTTTPAILTTDLSGCDEGYSKTSNDKNEFEDGSSLNPNCDYTSTMNGTSAATPTVSGVVAILLQVNPDLTWRDIKYILAKTARKVDPTRINMGHPAGFNLAGHVYDEGWITNTAGFNFHNWYGFGLVDITGAVNLATSYTSTFGAFTESNTNSSSNLNLSIPDNSSTGVENTVNVSSNLTIEAIQIKLDVTHPYVGDLGVKITAPSGKTSTIMNINSGVQVANISNEVLLTNAFYGESASGNWKIKIVDGYTDDIGTLNKWSIKVFGH